MRIRTAAWVEGKTMRPLVGFAVGTLAGVILLAAGTDFWICAMTAFVMALIIGIEWEKP